MAPPRREDKDKPLKPRLSPGNASPASSVARLDNMADLQSMLAEALCPLLEQMQSLHAKIDAQQTQLTESAKKKQKTEQDLKQVDANTQKLNKQVQVMAKKRASDETQLLLPQMEKASYVLRFQGAPESKGEDLKQIISDLLGPVTDLKADILQSEIDTIYRSFSEYTRKNNLPGKIVVRFSRRLVRNQMLKATNGVTLRIKVKEIKLLKDIPFEIRKKMKYKDLALFLQKTKITFRWTFPEGILFKFKDKREKIDSVEKAHEFLQRQTGLAEQEDNNNESKKETEEDEEEGLASSGEDSASELGAAAPKTRYRLRDQKDKKRGL